jgi:signal peptidase I
VAQGPALEDPAAGSASNERGSRAGRVAAARSGDRGTSRGARRAGLALVLLAAAVVLAIAVRAFAADVRWIPSGSMAPTLVPGDRVLVNKLAARFGDVRRGDVIVFDEPLAPPTDRDPASSVARWVLEGIGAAGSGGDVIKRVIALPGETWEISRGSVYVDGRRLREPYVHAVADDRSFGPDRVPAGHLFVLGDHRTASGDSRFSAPGYVPRESVIGTAVAIVWPPSRAGWL